MDQQKAEITRRSWTDKGLVISGVTGASVGALSLAHAFGLLVLLAPLIVFAVLYLRRRVDIGKLSRWVSARAKPEPIQPPESPWVHPAAGMRISPEPVRSFHDLPFSPTGPVFFMASGSSVNLYSGGIRQQKCPEPMPGGQPSWGPSVIDRIAQAERILVVGGSGSGKSTLLCDLVRRWQDAGEEIRILDPHDAPGSWPIQAIGRGRDYAGILSEVEAAADLLTDRYSLRADGMDFGHPIRWIIDEATGLFRSLPAASDPMQRILIEGRKVNLRLCLAGQSDRVRALGLVGAGDLIESFDLVVRLGVDPTGQRWVDAGQGREPMPWISSGSIPFQSRFTKPEEPVLINGSGGFEPVPAVPAVQNRQNRRPEPIDPEAETVLELFRAGRSLSEICRTVFGSKNGKNFEQVKAILRDAGRI